MFRIKLLICVFAITGICLAAAGNSGAPKVIGQVVASGAVLDGVAVPSGTTVFSDSALKTGEDPAVIRLVTGDLLQLGGNSAASFHSLQGGEVKVALNSGTLSYRSVLDKTITAASPASVNFPQRRTGASTNDVQVQAGVVALLTARAQAGNLTLYVNDTSRMNAEARTMIKTRDGKTHEVHYLKSIKKNVIVLKLPLHFTFEPEDMVIQGCQCDEAVGAPDNGVVAVLTETADKKDKLLKVKTIAMLDPEAPTLIKRKDGSIEEVHHIEKFVGDTVTLKEGLKYVFMPGDMIIQGCDVPPFFGFGWWDWKRGLLIGSIIGGGSSSTIYVITDDPCSPCQAQKR